jgi:hypothetical protein
MSAEKMLERETLHHSAAGRLRQRSCADMRMDLPLLQQRVSSAALEERAQDRLQAQRARGFRAVQHPRIAKSLMPQTTSKHGGVAEPIRRWMQGCYIEGKKECTN